MKVYVQVPVTGREWKEALREADALSEKVVAEGHEAVNPLRLMDNGQSGAPETIAPSASETARAMGRCVEALLGCDALLLHPAATDTGECPTEVRYSKGCRTEALAAITYGLRVLTLSEEGRLEEDTTRAHRAGVVIRSLGMVSDGYLAVNDRGGAFGLGRFRQDDGPCRLVGQRDGEPFTRAPDCPSGHDAGQVLRRNQGGG